MEKFNVRASKLVHPSRLPMKGVEKDPKIMDFSACKVDAQNGDKRLVTGSLICEMNRDKVSSWKMLSCVVLKK